MKQLSKQIIALRTGGMSYNDICATLKCSKSNVSYICNRYVSLNQELRIEHMKNLANNPDRLSKMRAGAATYYENLRTDRKQYWTKKLKQYPDLNFIYYIAGLHDGDGNHVGTYFHITNSDPRIIKSCLKFANDVLDTEYIVRLTIHATQDKSECIKFWTSIGVSLKHTYQKDSRNQQRDYSYKENYGTIQLRIKKPLGLHEALSRYKY